MYVYGLFKTNINPTFKDLFYVGITKDIFNRKSCHISRKRNTIKCRYIKKYGFNLRLLAIVDTREGAIEREIFLIQYFGRRDLKIGQLANLTDGGDYIENLSEETRNKISEKKSKFTKKEQLRFIEEFKKSGLCKTVFCKNNSITKHELIRMMYKYGQSLLLKRRSYNKNEKEAIMKDYQSSNLTMVEFSKQRNVGTFILQKCKKENGLFISKKKQLTKNEEINLFQEYLNSGLCAKQFAINNNYTIGTVQRIVRKYRIQKRSNSCYTTEFKLKMYQKFKESNLTISDFCKTNNLRIHIIYKSFLKMNKSESL